MKAASRGTRRNPAINELSCPARQFRLITTVAFAGTKRASRKASHPKTKIAARMVLARCPAQFVAAISNGFRSHAMSVAATGKKRRIEGPAARITG